MSESTISEPVPPTQPSPAVAQLRREESGSPPSFESFHWIVLGASIVVLALSFVLSTTGSAGVEISGLRWRLPETCLLHSVAGIDCPGCGLTRSFVSLAHGEWRRAWQFNPAGPLAFLFFASQIPFRIVQLWRLRIGAEPLDSPWLYLPLWGILGVMIAQWIARLSGWLTLP